MIRKKCRRAATAEVAINKIGKTEANQMVTPALLDSRENTPAYKIVETTTRTGKTHVAPEMEQFGYKFTFSRIDRNFFALITRTIFHTNK